MKKNDFKNKAKDLVTEMKIKAFYQLHKTKGMTYSFSQMLHYQGLNEVIEDITFSKTCNDFYEKIYANIDSYTKKALFPSIISGFLFGTFNGNINVYFSETQNKLLLSHNYNQIVTHRIIEEYKTIIYEFIKNDNALTNSIQRDSNNLNNNFNSDLTESHIHQILEQLFMDQSFFSFAQNENIRVVSKIILEMLVLYPPNILLLNKDFVEFEMKFGYFRKYSSDLNRNQKIPSLEERIETFELQKDITPEIKEQLDNLDLLEQRINTIGLQYRNNLYTLLKQATLELDRRKKIELIDDCYSLYEIAYRKEIIDNLFSPSTSVEITNYSELKNILVHLFIRDPYKLLDKYEDKIRKQIIAERDSNNQSEELTSEEQELLNKKMEYARNVQANPTIVDETLDMDIHYTDSIGLRGYTSDTTNQISTSFFSPETILQLGTCIGIGFDKNGLLPENIAISSPYYLTTNMGLNNLEIANQNMFKTLSSPMSELKKSTKSELVLFRKNIDSVTRASYVFVCLSGYNKEKDQEILLEAQRISTDNNLKLVVFNLPKIKQSLENNNIKEEHTSKSL